MSSNKKGFQENLFEKIYCISPKTFLWKRKKGTRKGELRPQWLKDELNKFYSLTGWKLHNCVNRDRKDFSSVQSLSHVWLFAIAWTAARQASLSIADSRNLLKLMSVESVMLSNHLILCCPLLFLPSIFPSIRVFSNESVLHIRWPKYWSFSFSISPSNEYSGLISFRIDWFDLLAFQGTLESSLAAQFKSISSLAIILLDGSTLTSIDDYWKNHSFD